MTNPLGPLVENFSQPPAPEFAELAGRFVTLERLDASRHAADLFQANGNADELFDYLGYGPFSSFEGYLDWQESVAPLNDPVFYALRDHSTQKIGGVAAFMRLDRPHGVIEIGHIQTSPPMQRTAAASEAIMMMIRWAFASGYRRVEWKCNALNAKSQRAARRYGFRYEGTFRNHMVFKGRSRDTAWFSIIDTEWPAINQAYQNWLAAENFHANGKQIAALDSFMPKETAQGGR